MFMPNIVSRTFLPVALNFRKKRLLKFRCKPTEHVMEPFYNTYTTQRSCLDLSPYSRRKQIER